MKLIIELPGTTPIVSLVRALLHMGVKINYMRDYSTEIRIRTEPLTATEKATSERITGIIEYSIREDTPNGAK